MKPQTLRWRFVNQSNPDQTIVVQDLDSSRTLMAILNQLGGNWIMQEESALGPLAPSLAPEERKPVMPPPAPKKTEKRERRSAERFMTEFRVILISGTSSFRAMSQDVSLGGMRLKKTIPASFLSEKCIAYVSHKDLRENIEIVCQVIADPTDPCRIQFVQPNQAQLKRLSDWLSEHNQGALPRGNKVAS